MITLSEAEERSFHYRRALDSLGWDVTITRTEFIQRNGAHALVVIVVEYEASATQRRLYSTTILQAESRYEHLALAALLELAKAVIAIPLGPVP